MNRLTPVTWDGHNINDGTHYASWLQQGTAHAQASAEPGLADRTHFGPVFTFKVRSARTFTLEIECIGHDLATHIDELKKWFSTYDETLRKLIVVDENAKQWYCMATPVSQPDTLGQTATFVLSVPDPIWLSETENSDTWAITASGQSKDITPGGNQDAYPIFEITPTSAKGGGFVYKRFVAIYGRTPGTNITNYPIDITGGGWDTTALVPASVKADGSDLIVVNNGRAIDRWIQDLDTDHTKIWCNLNFGDSLDVLLKTQIAATGAVSTIQVTFSTDAQNYLWRAPRPGLLLIGSEVFSYTGTTYSSPSALSFTGVKRAQNGTSMALHTVGTAIHFILNNLWIYYADPNYTWVNADENAKPMFDVADAGASTNASWVYTDFATTTGRRSGEWKPAYLSGHLKPSDFYTLHQGGKGTYSSPVTCMGMQASARPSGSTWLYGNAVMEWRLYHPTGITTVVCSGFKRRMVTTAPGWPALIALQYSANGSLFYNGANWPEATGGTVNVWTAWPAAGSRTSAFGATYRVIRFLMSGQIGAYTNHEADFEVCSVTITLDNTKTPYVVFGAQQGGYALLCTITNEETGEYLTLDKVLDLNQKLIVDTLNKLVTSDVDDSNWIGSLALDQPRYDWLKLLPGMANTLTFTDVGTSTVTFVTKWRDRNN